jgi:NAD(P)H-dependent flavin oxidoreductase YrpB (nitropropane dioxygenase family)
VHPRGKAGGKRGVHGHQKRALGDSREEGHKLVERRTAGQHHRGNPVEESRELAHAAFEEGQMEDTFAAMGQAVGLIHDVPTVKELFDRTVEEAIQVRERLDRAIPKPATK